MTQTEKILKLAKEINDLEKTYETERAAKVAHLKALFLGVKEGAPEPKTKAKRKGHGKGGNAAPVEANEARRDKKYPLPPGCRNRGQQILQWLTIHGPQDTTAMLAADMMPRNSLLSTLWELRKDKLIAQDKGYKYTAVKK